MPKIFISYRRDDSAYPAQSIHEKLVSHFGEDSVFFDVDSIPIGMDFHGILNDAVAECDVLLAVIGDHWLSAQDELGQRRLDNPDDFVRIEIEAALSRNIPVVPVLVGKASVPLAEEMPESLKKLARRNAAEVRPGRDFRSHLDQLVQGIEHVLERIAKQALSKQKKEESQPPRSPQQTGAALTKSLETITNSIGMKLALIPAGEFMMGSPHLDESARENEKPWHRVEITKPFCLGVYPVTQAEYENVTGDNPSHHKGDDRRPVNTVRWFDAIAFCNTLSDLEKFSPYYEINGNNVSIAGGNGYRLPTEAEWEFACRAGTTSKWSCGDEESQLGEYAWYDKKGGYTTHPVGEKKSNSWGLHDLPGNVWEWCWDWYGKDYYKISPASDPGGPASGERRVLRGGSYAYDARYLRSAYRTDIQPVYRSDDVIGFRVARNCD